MNNILQQILSLFSSDNDLVLEITEDTTEVKTEIVRRNCIIPTESEFNIVNSNLNSRDNIHISILEDDGEVHNYHSAGEKSFSTFLQEYWIIQTKLTPQNG